MDLDAVVRYALSRGPGTTRGAHCTMAWWKGHVDFIQSLALLANALNIRGYIIGGPV